MTDLVETLIEAASVAIRNQQTALKSPVGHVRSVTVELVLTSAGQIHEAVCYVERRTAAGAEVVTTHEGSGGMSDDVLQVTTEEQREQLHAARNHGGSCARCGRTLGDGETVYFESFLVDTRKLRARSETGSATISRAPVGVECVSSEMLQHTEGQPPAPCVGCGRGVYYGAGHSRRHRALCSRRCAGRANIAKRSGDLA